LTNRIHIQKTKDTFDDQSDKRKMYLGMFLQFLTQNKTKQSKNNSSTIS